MSTLLLAPVFVLVGLANVSTHTGRDAGLHNYTSTSVQLDAPSHSFSEMTQLEPESVKKLSDHALQRPLYSDARILFVHLRIDDTGGSANLSNFQVGYGDIFPLNTIATTSSNGAGWEEPNYGYVKYCRTF